MSTIVEKDLNFYKNNCEENYIQTPISILRYITELEKSNTELLEMNNELLEALEYCFVKVGKPFSRNKHNADYYDKYFEIEQLIQKHTKK